MSCGSAAAGRRCEAEILFRLCENEGVEKYAVVIHEDAERGFWAEVPALPGCYSQGDSLDELMANVREAIAGVLEVMKERGARPEANIQILDVAV
jgi:predicted RNase H-like HicB family nuclease